MLKFLKNEITEALEATIYYLEDSESLNSFLECSQLWINLFEEIYIEEIRNKIEKN